MSATYDRLLGLQSLAEDVLKSAGVATGATYKYYKNRSALASYFLSLGEESSVTRESKYQKILESVGADPREGIITALSQIAKAYHEVSEAPQYTYSQQPTYQPTYYEQTSSGPTVLTSVAPSSGQTPSPQKSTKTGATNVLPTKTGPTSSDSISQEKLATDNLQVATIAYLKQKTGIDDEAALSSAAAVINSAKILNPEIATEDLEIVIDKAAQVFESFGYKVDNLNEIVPQKSPASWDEINHKITTYLKDSPKYSSKTQRQIEDQVEKSLLSIQNEISDLSSGKDANFKQKLDLRYRRELSGYFDHTYSNLDQNEKANLVKNDLLTIFKDGMGAENLRLQVEGTPTLSSFLNKFNLAADGEELILQTIHAQAMSAGLNLEQAHAFTQRAFPLIKDIYYYSGFASPFNLNPKTPTPKQKDAFLQSSSNFDLVIATSDPQTTALLTKFKIGDFNLESIHQALVKAYGNPNNAPRPSDTSLSYTLKSLSAYLPASFTDWQVELATNFFDRSSIGRDLLRNNPQLQGFANAVGLRSIRKPSGQVSVGNLWQHLGSDTGFGANTMVIRGKSTPIYKAGKFVKDGAVKLGAKAWGKFATTALGKVVVKEGAKFAAKTGIKAAISAAGSFAPIVGNIIGWVIGEIVTELLDKTVGLLKNIADKILAEIGLSTDDFIKAGLFGAVAGVAFGSVGVGIIVGGTALIGAGAIAAVITLVVAAILLPILIIVLGIPIALALFLYIINSGSYIVPPSTYTLSSGPGGPVFLPPTAPGAGFDCENSGNPVSAPGATVRLLPSTVEPRPQQKCITPTTIVIHWSGGAVVNGVDRTYETLVQRNLACHYATDPATTLEMLQMWENKVEFSWCQGYYNGIGIGIEMSGNCFSAMPAYGCSVANVTPPPEAEIQRTINLACWLRQQYNIERVVGHFEIPYADKPDPGQEFLYNTFIPRMNNQCPYTPPEPNPNPGPGPGPQPI